MSRFDIEDLWKLSKDELSEYIEARLTGKLFQGKPVEPIVIIALGEMPENFLASAYKLDKNGAFKRLFNEVVKSFLFRKIELHNVEDELERTLISRLIYLAEILNLDGLSSAIFGFAMSIEYKQKSGAKSPDIYFQFLRALAQFQEAYDLTGFWYKRFSDDYYAEYSQPLFVGLRLSSPEGAGYSLPRLFYIAKEYPGYFDKNLALRPLVKLCANDGEITQRVAAGFSHLPADEQKMVTELVWDLDRNLIQPLLNVLSGAIFETRKDADITYRIWDLNQPISKSRYEYKKTAKKPDFISKPSTISSSAPATI
jgi:hypothetical protein